MRENPARTGQQGRLERDVGRTPVRQRETSSVWEPRFHPETCAVAWSRGSIRSTEVGVTQPAAFDARVRLLGAETRPALGFGSRSGPGGAARVNGSDSVSRQSCSWSCWCWNRKYRARPPARPPARAQPPACGSPVTPTASHFHAATLRARPAKSPLSVRPAPPRAPLPARASAHDRHRPQRLRAEGAAVGGG